jgi:glycosyltransferase involved in cell wall biosynthesis
MSSIRERSLSTGGTLTEKLLRILLIGPHPESLHGPAVGGTTIPFKLLVASLTGRDGVVMSVVNTQGIRGGGVRAPLRYLRVLGAIAREIPRNDVVSLHAVRSGLHSLAPFVSVLSRLFGRPYLIRKFGGTDYSVYPAPLRALIHWSVKNANLYLVETKALVEGARHDGIEHVRWYSNSRPMPELPEEDSAGRECLRFVCLGQLRRGKGLAEVIEAGERFGGDVVVDVYGTSGYDVPVSIFDRLDHVGYRGSVGPDDVRSVLSGYDATGILVEPRSADSLHAAMRRLREDPVLFRRLRAGVRERRREFDSEFWADRFLEFCREIAGSSVSRFTTDTRVRRAQR